MWVWSNLHVLLLILTNVYEALCQEKSSLTFVIDNTYSMADDISQVKVNADGITKIVFDEKASQIKNMVLVTFNDPVNLKVLFHSRIPSKHTSNTFVMVTYNVELISSTRGNARSPVVLPDRTVVLRAKKNPLGTTSSATGSTTGVRLVTPTENRTIFKRNINSLSVRGGGDCPEMSMSGIIQALQASLPGSFIYVFTDASAKDYFRSHEVKNICQKKQSQIVFVLTGFCSSRDESMYQVYYDIAAACSGLAFDVEKYEVNEILSTIKETITGKKAVITTKKIPAYTISDIPFNIDDQTEYAIVTASGLNVNLEIRGPKAELSYLTWLPNVKVMKINRPTSGTYIARVYGKSQTSVYVVGRTDFTFTHGFSKMEPKSLKDTTPQPIANTPTLLSISVTDPKHTVDILLVHILDMDEKIINSLILRQVSKDFYTTSIPFRAPSKRFKIAVIGKEVRTGKSIRRIAKLPVTPQEPPKVGPKIQKPSLTISEGNVIKLEYGQTVKLTCKVTAYPAPKIEWLNRNRVPLMSESSAVEPPYEYISYLTIVDVEKSERYTCHAKNNAGETTTAIEVIVKEPFKIKAAIDGITTIEYGTKGTLRCDITAPVPMHITWDYIDENTGVRKQIIPSYRYSISADGTVLTINKMDSDMIGTYRCKAVLDKNTEKTSVHQAQVKISGLTQPKATGDDNINVLKGSNVSIACHITGTPEPTIIWLFKAKDATGFVSIHGSSNVLQIPNIDVHQAGSYKCKAHNIKGDSEHLTALTVLIPPNIISGSTNVYKGVEGYDPTLKIPCVATGLPKPIITWTVNGVSISESAKYSINNGTLIIWEPMASDNNKYRCEAKNDAGSTHAWFQAYIRQLPLVSGEMPKTVKTGEPVNISCKIRKGVPKPTITWHFMAKDASEFISLPTSTEGLSITKANRHHTGTYKCIARNEVGNHEHSTSLTVEFAPIILSDYSETLKGVEGDIALHIPCVTIGEPKPSVTWKMNNSVITANEHYLLSDRALVIKGPMKNDSNVYTCEAKNYLGLQQATFDVAVEAYLDEFGPVQIENIARGETTKLKCVSGDPSQSVRWFLEGVDTGIKGNYFHIAKADVSMDGNYTCHVSDTNGTLTKTYQVIIGYPPIFSFPQEEPLVDWSGSKDDILNCDVEAKPVPDIIWTFNGKVLSHSRSSRLSVSGNWGHYTCSVKNVHGEVQRSFDVTSSQCLISRQPRNIKKMPLILTPTATWPMLDATTDYVKVEPGQTVMFSCPNAKDQTNNFQKLPGINETEAVCDREDIFKVGDTSYKVSDLQCAQEGSFIVNKRHTRCASETSELIRVGFEVHGFLETYEVCYDTSNKVPLYTRAMMFRSNQGSGTTYDWYKHPEIVDGNKEAVYNCKHSTSTCCYDKTQLVNTQDFSDGPAQKSTFIDSLNAVPYWRPCDIKQSPWDSIEDKVRSRLNIFDQFVVWSGTYMLQNKNGGVVPRYLWKVVRFDEDEAIAIIYINGPSPSESDILCTNTCPDEYSVPWFQKSDKYTYCCNVDEFLEAINLSETSIGEPMTTAV